MVEQFPVLAALLFVVIAFIYASKRGVISLLASGTSIGIGVALLLAGFQYLPGLAKAYLDIDLTWQFSLGLSACVGGLVFIVLRLILAFALKHLFNPDSPLHPLVDGTPGGFLSIFPSLVAVFLFFTCVRAAGTVQELNYVDSLAQSGIERMAGKIPPPPPSIQWRNAIESLPYLAPLLDQTDPFSRRLSRNAAALTLIARSTELRAHLFADPEIAGLIEAGPWALLADDPAVAKVISTRDRVGLVTAPAIQQASIDFPDRSDLENLVLLPDLREFTRSLVPIAEPEAESF
jgi:hypothetical protein